MSTPEQEVEYRQHRFSPPPGSTELFLVRHGESAPAKGSAPFDLVDGQADPDLAPEGRDHAERVGRRLADERISALYVTTLRRTSQTAAPLAAKLGLTPELEADLREIHLGDWENGLFRRYTHEGHPIVEQLWREQRWDVIPGAETMEAFGGRIRAAIGRLAAANPDRRIAVFTHGGVIGEVFAQASAAKNRFAFLGADNGSISHLVVSGDNWMVRRFNDTSHLQSPFG
ncbi:histidine phosphatase family protein [Amycolatopsis regifaucium]|uniref:Histidine phosphatase family protein n=1 Tax=Amycolatopsis regifaucium TaxID=546365 RepID=A0A154MQR8_9PSEU|nr:histidine phosphatase family protein [Amycolatopsis regifaucium]KZB86681.1 phosphoglycerate kinase [Amycolatopsis regifaucium]OKA03687.1 histidine phosphatase family protein [Amycolatopsis regifaucium]SFJ21479.1 probable phosphoglycerate mutase [Amycolatopsis regifaucium]